MATNVEYILTLKDQFSRGVDDAKKSVDGLDNKISSLKGGMKNMFSGLAMGAGMAGFQMLTDAVVSFGQNAIKEFEEAERISNELQRTLRTVGRESYFNGLITESNNLAETFKGLYDNDDIIVAQTKLINYGKVTREEISKLIPVIANLSAKEGIDLVQATESVINIMAGRGGNTLRQYGLSVKGTATEHDRLNLILGEFQNKLNGSIETYAKTAQGIAQTNKVLLANIEENFGESFANIKMKVMPIITTLLNGMNALLSSRSQNLLNAGERHLKENDYVSAYGQAVEKKYADQRKKGLIDSKEEYKQVITYYNNEEKKQVEKHNESVALIAKTKNPAYNTDNVNIKREYETIAVTKAEMKKTRELRQAFIDANKADYGKIVNPAGDMSGTSTKNLATSTKTNSKKTNAIGSNVTRSQATGSKAITINVSIKDLIGTNNMNITNIKEGANKLQDMVVGALTGAVNDFQLIVE
jgi:hypothetical protein